jgi:hypothetical protein
MTNKKANVAKKAQEKNSELLPVTKADVPRTIEVLKAQLAEKRKNIDETVSLDISYQGTNIKNVTTVGELMEISASINSRAEAYERELTRYGLDKLNIAKFEQSGKSVQEWIKIISKASNELINKAEITKLENAINKLSKHLDAETQLANELAEIMGDASQAIK